MLHWAIDYWYLCIIALLIGIATAAWIWLSGRSDAALPQREIDEPRAPIQAIRPEIERAEPVNFAAPLPEPVVVAVPVAAPIAAMAAPGAEARPAIAAAVGGPDDLLQVKGIGPKLNALLGSLGVTRFDQIAGWGTNEIAEVDQYLGTFRGRIVRDNWVEQAGLLARGDVAGFTARFGQLDSENKR